MNQAWYCGSTATVAVTVMGLSSVVITQQVHGYSLRWVDCIGAHLSALLICLPAPRHYCWGAGPRSAPSAGGPSSLPTLDRTSSSLDEAPKPAGNGQSHTVHHIIICSQTYVKQHTLL